MKILVGIVFVLWSTSAAAQDKTRLNITHSGDDRVGAQVLFYLKEAVAKSARFAEGYSHNISVVSLPINDGGTPVRSALSVQYEIFTLGRTPMTKTNRDSSFAHEPLTPFLWLEAARRTTLR